MDNNTQLISSIKFLWFYKPETSLSARFLLGTPGEKHRQAVKADSRGTRPVEQAWPRCRAAAVWLVGGQPAPQLPMPAHVKTPSLLSNTVPTTLWGPHFCCYCHPFQVSFQSPPLLSPSPPAALEPCGTAPPPKPVREQPPSQVRSCGQEERGKGAAFPSPKLAGFPCL